MRYVPEHPEKGSPEAYAWAEKMRAARQKKARTRYAVRQAGLKTEAEFFGPGGPLEVKALKKHKLNPGAQWHEGEENVAYRYKKQAKDQLEKAFFAGVEAAHHTSKSAAKKLGMNPRKRKPEWFFDGASQSYILDLGEGAYQIRRQGDRYRYSFVIGSEVIYIRDAGSVKEAMSNIDRTAGTKFKRPFSHTEALACAEKIVKHEKESVNKNPIAIYNPPAREAGTIYNNAIEIRAQKTGGPLKGHYRHVFGKNVRIIGLTDGTVLLQHKDGKPLWITRKDYERSGRKH